MEFCEDLPLSFVKAYLWVLWRPTFEFCENLPLRLMRTYLWALWGVPLCHQGLVWYTYDGPSPSDKIESWQLWCPEPTETSYPQSPLKHASKIIYTGIKSTVPGCKVLKLIHMYKASSLWVFFWWKLHNWKWNCLRRDLIYQRFLIKVDLHEVIHIHVIKTIYTQYWITFHWNFKYFPNYLWPRDLWKYTNQK